MSYLRIIVKRLALLVLVVLGVSVITFVVSHLIPGDPARLIAGDKATEDIVANVRQSLGLDRPLVVQVPGAIWTGCCTRTWASPSAPPGRCWRT